MKKAPKYFGKFRTKRELMREVKRANPLFFSRKTKYICKITEKFIEPFRLTWVFSVTMKEQFDTAYYRVNPETLKLTYINID